MHALASRRDRGGRPQPVFAQKLGRHPQRQRPVELALHGALAYALRRRPAGNGVREAAGATPRNPACGHPPQRRAASQYVQVRQVFPVERRYPEKWLTSNSSRLAACVSSMGRNSSIIAVPVVASICDASLK